MSKYLNKIKCICDHGWLWSETNQIFVRCEQCKCVNYKCDRTSCPKCGDIIERDTQTRPTFSVGINPARAITIYCHPSIKDKIQEVCQPAQTSCHHSIGGFNIMTDEHLIEWKGKWKRTNILADNQFVTMIDDLDHPPSWAIYFGLVDKKMEPRAYLIDHNRTQHEINSGW